jgi:hypothetical protein
MMACRRRAALQEGLEPLRSLGAPGSLRRNLRTGYYDEAAAVDDVVWGGFGLSISNPSSAEPWQPPEHGRRKPLPSPHVSTKATMHLSGRR